MMYDEFMTKKKDEVYINVDFSNNIFVAPENIKDKFANLNQMSDEQIYNIFVQYLDTILDSIFRVRDPQMIQLFTDQRFITIITRAAHSMQFTDTQKKRCNKLVYDYVVKSHDRDEMTHDLLVEFSRAVNKDVIPKLCGFGLSSKTAAKIAMARYSSEKEILNTKRLNKIIVKEPYQIMTEQMIVNIYCALYTSALDMFEGVMYDVVSYQSMNNNSIEVYGTITLAVLDILDQLPMNIIKEVLRRFSENYFMLHADSALRFNIESFSPEDYPRINSMLIQLENEGITFPRT